MLYPALNLLTELQQISRSLTFAWDQNIAFLPWMILPYNSSALMLILAFMMVDSKARLRQLSLRLLFATAISSVFFLLYPLQHSFDRPLMSAFWQQMYGFLDLVDKPYNQLPSLHVIYGLIMAALF